MGYNPDDPGDRWLIIQIKVSKLPNSRTMAELGVSRTFVSLLHKCLIPASRSESRTIWTR